MPDSIYRKIALLTLLLCLGIVILGAYVRLSDAGLGCPDWPGCYGRLLVPEASVAQAHEGHEQRPLEAPKAWKEMVHRYFASSLGLLIIALAVFGWRRGLPRSLLAGLVAVVCFQGILGMWTVTWQLKPLAVTAHLLGGMSTLGLLLWLNLLLRPAPPRGLVALRGFAVAALLVLVGQIFLGGWTSSNYAALACPDFPTCHAQWWPADADFDQAFVLWHGLGINYEYGILESPARTAIHLTHRIGALITTAVLGLLAWRLWRRRPLRPMAAALGAGLLLQISLGIASVKFGLPLPVAAAHNAGAALLVLILVWINVQAWRETPDPGAVSR